MNKLTPEQKQIIKNCRKEAKNNEGNRADMLKCLKDAKIKFEKPPV